MPSPRLPAGAVLLITATFEGRSASARLRVPLPGTREWLAWRARGASPTDDWHLLLRLRPHRDLVVQVLDEERRPVPGALVSGLDPVAEFRAGGQGGVPADEAFLRGFTDEDGVIGWRLAADPGQGPAEAERLRLFVVRLGGEPFVREVAMPLEASPLRLVVPELATVLVQPVRPDGERMAEPVPALCAPTSRADLGLRSTGGPVLVREQARELLEVQRFVLPPQGRRLSVFHLGRPVRWRVGGRAGEGSLLRRAAADRGETLWRLPVASAAPPTARFRLRLTTEAGELALSEDHRLRLVVAGGEPVREGGEDLPVRILRDGALELRVPPRTEGEAVVRPIRGGSSGEEELARLRWPALEPEAVHDLGPVVLERRPVLATGVVRDAEGEAVAGCRVVLGRGWRGRPVKPSTVAAEAVTDAQGRFVLRGVLPFESAWFLKALREGHRGPAVELVPGEEARLELLPLGRLRVPLGLPDEVLGHVRVRLERRGPDSAPVTWEWNRPVFTADGLVAGRYDLAVLVDGWEAVSRHDIAVSERRTTELPEIAELLGALDFRRVTVRVEDAEGTALPGLRVGWDLRQDGGGTFTPARSTDARGEIRCALPTEPMPAIVVRAPLEARFRPDLRERFRDFLAAPLRIENPSFPLVVRLPR